MIELKQVSKTFDSTTVIKDISLSIQPGEVVGFLGPNGAGKTTTVRMIAGVLPPSKGQVLVNGQDFFSEDVSQHGQVGYLPENNPIYDDMTVEEFLKFWAKIKKITPTDSEQKIKKAVEAAGLRDVFYRPIIELSKGYRQRTGLAQAILAEPEILLLDEPTEGLDPNQRREIHDLIKGIGKKRTVIICSHVLSEITRMCSRIIIINKGQIVADSPTSQLDKLASGQQSYEFVASGKDIKTDLKALPGLDTIEQSKEDVGHRFYLTTSSDEDLRLPIFELAKTKNWKLYELTRRQVDLEDIFTKLTQE
ncbi:ABC transporter ATP-binding protein [Candidatus Beckwithbacteria bacterium]|nr:ABC transporter ATP-binding protein [Candidatus Beckwithbacteria bacterium]